MLGRSTSPKETVPLQYQETRDKLAQTRDELRLQVHLFKAEALDEWHSLEKRWEQFTREVDQEARATDDNDENTSALIRSFLEAVENGYHNLREALRDPLP